MHYYKRIKVPNLSGKGNVSRTIPAYVWDVFVHRVCGGDEDRALDVAASLHSKEGGLDSYSLSKAMFEAILRAEQQVKMAL
ncbi:hypothetical protein D6779_05635 [Candidatus Parcubacteria bacterium]|nr:MAG: hypothetical protein D6779_05635 [Candidatus Parcubacteria bacterium]